jgi:TetR/AcrR family tetracycline transcriptional repressor
VARQNDLDLDASEIIAAAVEIYREQGLDAVSMRTVANRLGVSPVPVYSRVGNKDALLEALAAALFADLAPTAEPDEPWQSYAARWCGQLRNRLLSAPEPRLILGARRPAYVEASRPLVASMRRGGLSSDAAIQGCRLLMWGTVGFVAMAQGPTIASTPATEGRLAGSDPAGVTREEVDTLFTMHVSFLIAGIERTWSDGAPALTLRSDE